MKNPARCLALLGGLLVLLSGCADPKKEPREGTDAGTPSEPSQPPVFTEAPSGTWSVEAGGVRALHAEAEDPGGSALRFTWTASDGALGTPRDTATTSDVTWTAPACGAPESPVAITVTVTNAENLSATASFSAVGLPACPSWAPTGSLTTARHGHTATLLPSGQVLVVGNARSGAVTSPAELYDPETGLWSAAPGEATTRSFPTATLLPSGRVLVAGGFQHDSSQNLATAELYTP